MRKNLLTLLICSVGLLLAQETPILRNGGFEELDETGYPANWTNQTPCWQASSNVAYEGERSICYANSIRGDYKFISAPIAVEVGKTYEFSAVAKIVMRDIPDPPKIHGFIFLEYFAGGKWVGGCYGSSETPLNNEWIRIHNRGTIPPNAESATIGLLVSPQGTPDAEVWFDSVEIHEVEGDVFTTVPTTDCYRDETASGKVTVYCGIGENPPFDREAFRSARLSVLSHGKEVQGCPVVGIQEGRVSFVFDAEGLSPGLYTLQCSVTDPRSGRTHTTREQPFRRLEKAPSYRVHVDRHRRMIIDGQQFFPLGMYFMDVTKEELVPYLDTAFNCLMPYKPPHDREMLDYLQAQGLKLFFSVNHASSRDGNAENSRRMREHGYATIDTLKDHPAIVAWYINDELPVKFVQDAIDYRRGCEEHDPSRPTWSVLTVPKDWHAFLPASDIHGSDPYPIPENDIANAYKWAKAHDAAVLGSKMLLQVPQAFSWGRYWKTYGYTEAKTASCPMPTEREIEAMAWMAIAGGANGLMFYSYFDLRLRDEEMPGLPAFPFDETFAGMKRVAERIAEHFPVLLSAGTPVAFTNKADKGDITVVFRAYELDGITWLLAVNTTADKDGSFNLEMARPVTLAGTSLGTADITVDECSVKGVLKPLQPLFIKLK